MNPNTFVNQTILTKSIANDTLRLTSYIQKLITAIKWKNGG